jgi:hypothetical protein
MMQNIKMLLGLTGFTWNPNPNPRYIKISKFCLLYTYSFVLHAFLLSFAVIIPLERALDTHKKDICSIFGTVVTAYTRVEEMVGFAVFFLNRKKIYKIMKTFVKLISSLTSGYIQSELIIIREVFWGPVLILSAHYLHWAYVGSRLDNVPLFLLHIILAFAEYAIHMHRLLVEATFLRYKCNSQQIIFQCANGNKVLCRSSIGFIKNLQSCHLNRNYMRRIAETVNNIYTPFVLFIIGLGFLRSVQNVYRMISAFFIFNYYVSLHSHALMYLGYHWMKHIFITQVLKR